MNIRKIAYNIVDALKGGKIRKNLADIEASFGQPHKHRKHRLSEILEHATQTTPYYRRYAGYTGLSDFPLLDKAEIKRDIESFISEPYKNSLSSLNKATTSGSYGTPFTFYFSSEKRGRVISEIFYFGRSSSLDVGVKHAHFLSKEKTWLSQFLQNQVMFKVNRLDDNWCFKTTSILRKKMLRYWLVTHQLS